MAAVTASVRRRMGTLAVLEFVNIPLIAWAVVGWLRMPPTAANLAGLVLVLAILAEGGAYWWLKARQLAAGAPAPAGLGVYRGLIRRLSEENRLWGTERVRGELLKLGITVGNGSVRRCRWRPAPRPPSQTWGPFLRNHAHAIWAADLLTVQTLTFRSLYVFFISHGRREHMHVPVAAHPAAAWVWRQLIEATPWGREPTFLIRDRDRVDGGDFGPRAVRLGLDTVLTPFRAPKANAIAERVVRTLRND